VGVQQPQKNGFSLKTGSVQEESATPPAQPGASYASSRTIEVGRVRQIDLFFLVTPLAKIWPE